MTMHSFVEAFIRY